jgi:hypothetical protein
MTDRYTKVLVARFSPQNRCYVADGEVLTVIPKKNLRRNKDTAHKFVSTGDPSLTSKFGWVHEVPAITLEQFLCRTSEPSAVSNERKEHIQTMLSSIALLREDTPVAATYKIRGVIERRHVFVVHRVIFWQPRPAR